MHSRSEIFSKLKRIVIKLGSHVLTGESEGLDTARIGRIASEIALLCRSGIEVIVVSSGAMAAGRPMLGLSEKPQDIPRKQAVAAVGQPRLMRVYEEEFEKHGMVIGQILLTGDDLAVRQRFINARAAIDALLSFGALPIINENDTVAVEEIKFGDNDSLSALVTNLVEANLLVIMSDVEGLYDADPRGNPDAGIIRMVRNITDEIEKTAGGAGSSVGTGGMATKIAAAKKAAQFGIPTIILNGSRPENLSLVFSGGEVGTLFLPAKKSLNRRKHWIATSMRTKGKIRIDFGAGNALRSGGKSLLSSGIIDTEGLFDRGEAVKVVSLEGEEIARGITQYSSAEIEKIMGRHSSEIEEILGYKYSDEVIHRDNLVLTN